MAWKFADERLERRGLNAPSFRALHPDETEYDILLLQNCGTIEAGADGIYQPNNADAATKLAAFFSLASQIQPALLLTPEYSCPWNAMGDLIDGEAWPDDGNLWIVGCESITPSQLDAFQNRHSIRWVYDLPTAQMEQRFLTPVCFLFPAHDRDGNLQRVALLQFKQKPMADRANEIEVRYMIRGAERFIFRNSDQSIHLAVIICAESLSFDYESELSQPAVLPYLLLHPQLNPKPRYSQFRAYREYWADRRMKRMEILALNWARGTSVRGFSFQFGGSGWYFKLNNDNVDIPDCRVDNAHGKGFYYARCKDRHYDCRVLNYDECVLHLKSLKVWQMEAPAAAYRDRIGPEAMASYSWDRQRASWINNDKLDDGFQQTCAEVAADLEPLTGDVLSPSDKERLVCLTSGDIMPSSKTPWPSIASLQSLMLTSEEVCQRVTFCHDPDYESREARRRRLHAFCTLKNEIISGIVPFPTHLHSLQTCGELRYPAGVGNGASSFNVSRSNGEFAATFVFLGDASEAHAQKRMEDLASIIKEAKRNLVVWFRENGQLRYICPPGRTNFTADLNESERSYTRETPTGITDDPSESEWSFTREIPK